ncbi:unnamed protein product [Phyllotreta striolata]|uniref:28S ribosomal protein S22, mitochondrial n=1 Tax=Phyllotreta striolata TaxID=444603 RepID=A0A9N9TPP0_PHYSR|nr:unnamed protein product [Phyllotreta striolata]
MAALRHISQSLLRNFLKTEIRPNPETCSVCIRLLNYSSIDYDDKHDPSPKFFNKEVQSLLKDLTRIDLGKVNKRKRLGSDKLEEPVYQFMTDEELQKATEAAIKKSEELLQIPPVVSVRKPINRVLSEDPALQGLEQSTMVFTDITFGIRDSDRLIVVREPSGILKEAEWDVKNRMNQLYFPKEGRLLKPPKMFFGEYFESLLERKEYEFILDRACLQFEPNDPDYQRVTSITYQHVNDKGGFEMLRSTRHFGALVFFLAWHKNIDNLLLDLIETSYIEEGSKLLDLYSKLHDVNFKSSNDLEKIEEYIKNFAKKKAGLELGVQAYKDVLKQRQELEEGIKVAHGLR